MKTPILMVAFALFAQIPTNAQSSLRKFKPFRTEFAFGYVHTKMAENQYALDFAIEPKYGITDACWFGLRMEAAVLVAPTALNDDFQAFGIYSVLPTFDYSFVISKKFRPFVGIGGGSYTFKGYYDGEGIPMNKAVTRFGYSPRFGFEFRRMRLGVEFNFVPEGGSYTAFKLAFPFGETELE